MTRVQTAGDVIEQTKAFHQMLSEFYENLSGQVEQERVKLLLEYMSRHQENIASVMKEYAADVAEKILNTWLMFSAKECDLSPFTEARIDMNMSPQEVIDIAIRIDDCIIETYKAMLNKEVPDDISCVFEDLLKLEEREKVKMAKAALKIETL